MKNLGIRIGQGSVCIPQIFTLPEPPQHPHNRDPWNHYCFDTHAPCENKISTDTGIMQIVRTVWDSTFAGQDSSQPSGYFVCSWDSLEWNWKVNIHDGKYIFFTNNKFHMLSTQAGWDSVCTRCEPSDSLPQYENWEDLWTYGYKWGTGAMQGITVTNWLTKMKSKEGKYVRDVRGSKYAAPW